ncbi:MAG: hypothetical protein E7666_04195 [Ruminococcaceae bacterium]|nr:hypothetical protein [Oscillospiraceae bacterium]
MNLKKSIPVIVSSVGVLSLIGAILIFVLAVPNANAAYKQVLEVILACLMLLLAACAGYYMFITRDVDPNFFLFDRAKKRNIPVENLTFTIVNERMTFFLTMVCESVEQLWQENVLESDRKLGYRRVYRPLLAYKMIYDLADKNLDSYWDAMLNAAPDVLNSLYSALAQGGEQEMVKAFRYIMENYRENPSKIKDFIIGNQKYIRGRMLGYIKRNIELFY